MAQHTNTWQALEAACRGLQDPAGAAAASAWLLQFRASAAPYEACTFVLEQPQSSEAAKFQAIGALRDAAVREWATLGADVKAGLWRCLVFTGCMQRAALVVGAAAAAAATLLKRLWGEVPAAEHGALIQHIESLASNPAAALALMTAILVELSPTTASPLGMPWSYHEQCRRQLQEEGHVLAFVQHGISAARATASSIAAGADDSVCLAGVKLLVAAFSWDFEPCASWATPHDQRPADVGLAVKLPADDAWRSVVVGERAWSWVPQCLQSGQHLGPMLHDALWQLTVQLCCVEGTIFTPAAKAAHFRAMCSIVLPALPANGFSHHTADRLLHACRALLALARVHRLHGFLEAPSGAPLEMLENLTTGVLLHDAVAPSDWAEEAGNALLEAWVELLSTGCAGRGQELQQPALSYVAAVFDAACERQLASVARTAEDDEIEFAGEEEAYSEAWLASLAFLGRASALLTLGALQARLDACQASLNACMQSGADVAACLERLCWVTQVVGFVLADSGDGETPMMPLELASACSAAGAAGQLDPVVALGQRLLALGGVCVEAAGHEVVSPRLLEEVCRALGRWAETYLPPEEGACAALVEAFGAASGGPRACDLLVSLGIAALTKYAGETALHRAACERLLSPLGRRAAPLLVRCPAWAQLCEACSSRQQGVVALEAGVQRQLYQFIIDGVARAHMPPAAAAACIQQLLGPVVRALLETAAQPAAALQRADRAQAVLGLVHSLTGAARGQPTEATQQPVFAHLAAACQAPALQLLKAYQRQGDVATAIVQLAVDVVENHAAYLSSSEAGALFNWVRAVVAACAAHHAGNAAAAAGEERAESLEAMLCLVSALASCEVPGGVDLGAAVFDGLTHIVPLFSVDYLAFPRLAHSFFTLLAHTCEAWAPQLAALPPPALRSVLAMLGAGMGISDDAETAAAVFEAAAALARWHLEARRAGAQGLAAAAAQGQAPLGALLHALLQRVLLDDPGGGCLGYATEAALWLILAEPGTFQAAAMAVVSGAGAQDAAAQVGNAFSSVAGAAAACSAAGRRSGSEFEPAFNRFVLDVRGIARRR